MIAPDVPAADEVTEGWWEATRKHRLVVQCCTECDGRQHPPRAVCIACGSTEHLDWTEANGQGIVDSVTVVHRAPRPDIDVPYVIARVRLDEGPILLTRLEQRDVDAWTIGDTVSVAWVDLANGRALPIFHPINT